MMRTDVIPKLGVIMDWSLWDVLWTIIVFFFWVMYIWLFISIFADILRREDTSGWAKAGWLLLIIFFPLLGALIYLIVRPKALTAGARGFGEPRGPYPSLRGLSPTEEIARAHELLSNGAISQDEFDQLKRRALA
jgi:hypothetical protein